MAYTPKTWVNSDPITASDLNRIETGVDDVDIRVATMEASTTSIAGISAASGWSLSSSSIKKVGSIVSFYFTFTRSGTSISGSTNGNIANTAVLTLPAAYTPTVQQAFVSADSGHLCNYILTSSGTLSMVATVPNNDISNGNTFSVAGTYMV